jgi:two-component system NtrC family response regulator
VEKSHILKILKFFSGNRQKTAETLGISRKTLYRKLAKYGTS